MTAAPRNHGPLRIALVAAALGAIGFAVVAGTIRAVEVEGGPAIYEAAASTAGAQVYAAERTVYPYAPTFYALIAPLRALAPEAAGAAWLAFGDLCLAFAFLALARIFRRSPLAGARDAALAAAAIGVAPATFAAVATGEPALLVLALVVGAIWAYLTHRDEIGGLLAALAMLVKVTPALFLVYFAWKGRWRVVAWSVIGLVLFGVALPAAVFGGADAGRLYGEFGERLLDSLRGTPPLEMAAALAMTALTLFLARPAPDEVRLSRRVLLELGAACCLMLLGSPGLQEGHFTLLAVPLATTSAVALEGRSPAALAAAPGAVLLGAAAVVLPPLAVLEASAILLIVFALVAVRAERREEDAADAAAPPTDLELSVFFPAYNEGGNIGRVVEGALAVLPRIARTYEVIVVDDASRDDTPEVARALAAKHPDVVRHVRHEKNRGYGGAVKTGLASARYAHVFYSDGDGQFDLSELPAFARPLAGGRADAVIGYRRKRRDPFFRKVNAYGWGALVRTLFGIGARDIDCAYKLLPMSVVRRLELKSEGALISTEILAKMERAGVRIVERPVTHLPRERGTPTGANPKVILRAFKELVKFRRELSGFR
jgi:hypothetical protein